MTTIASGRCAPTHAAPSTTLCRDRRARCVRPPTWLSHCPDPWCDVPMFVELNPTPGAHVTCLCDAVGRICNIGRFAFTLELVSSGRFKPRWP